MVALACNRLHFPMLFLGSLTPSKVLNRTCLGVVRNLEFKNPRPKYRSGGRVDSRDWFPLTLRTILKRKQYFNRIGCQVVSCDWKTQRTVEIWVIHLALGSSPRLLFLLVFFCIPNKTLPAQLPVSLRQISVLVIYSGAEQHWLHADVNAQGW